jgi:hypothetical protein
MSFCTAFPVPSCPETKRTFPTFTTGENGLVGALGTTNSGSNDALGFGAVPDLADEQPMHAMTDSNLNDRRIIRDLAGVELNGPGADSNQPAE